MLSFDIRSLEVKAAQVDGSVAPDDSIWEEGDARPAAPIDVTGRLSSAGDGRFYFSGHLRGSATLPCRKCLEEVSVPAADEAHFLFAETGADEAEDPDVFLYDPRARMLDMRAAVRESWLLTAPAFVECRENCKGLCVSCGTNLNDSTCDCASTKTDKRWDALLKHKSDAR